jgi:hypothetical protein
MVSASDHSRPDGCFSPFKTILGSFSRPGGCPTMLTDRFGVRFCQKRQIASTDLSDRP